MRERRGGNRDREYRVNRERKRAKIRAALPLG